MIVCFKEEIGRILFSIVLCCFTSARFCFLNSNHSVARQRRTQNRRHGTSLNTNRWIPDIHVQNSSRDRSRVVQTYPRSNINICTSIPFEECAHAVPCTQSYPRFPVEIYRPRCESALVAFLDGAGIQCLAGWIGSGEQATVSCRILAAFSGS